MDQPLKTRFPALSVTKLEISSYRLTADHTPPGGVSDPRQIAQFSSLCKYLFLLRRLVSPHPWSTSFTIP